MTDSSTSSKKSSVEVVYKKVVEDESSEEVPMEDWSSLELDLVYYNLKRDLHEQGLYDPGSEDICAKYICMSDSSVLRHVYYNYPAVKDPGVLEALEQPEPVVTYADDGQDLYLAVCRIMHICPIRIFHKSLLSKTIDLKYYGIYPQGFRAMAIALCRNTFVKTLDLTDNWIPHDGCLHLGEMIKENDTLVEIDFTGCRIGPRGTQILAHYLQFNRTLRKLNLSGNEMEDTGAEFLSSALRLGSRLVDVNLSRNKLSAKAVYSLCEAFDVYNRLTHLNLSWNMILSPKAVFTLCNYLAENKSFSELDLSWNSVAGSRMGQAIQTLLSNNKINRVILNHNRLSGEAVKFIALGLIKAKKLETLDLSFNPLTSSDAFNLLFRLKDRRVKLKNLLLDNVIVETKFIQTLKEIQRMKSRQKTLVTHGYVNPSHSPMPTDIRPLLLRRAEAIGQAAKKKTHRVDAALVFMQMYKMHPEPMNIKEFSRVSLMLGLHLGDPFVDEMYDAFPGPKSGKLVKLIDMAQVMEFVKRLYPDRRLPATPPSASAPPTPPPPSNPQAKSG